MVPHGAHLRWLGDLAPCRRERWSTMGQIPGVPSPGPRSRGIADGRHGRRLSAWWPRRRAPTRAPGGPSSGAGEPGRCAGRAASPGARWLALSGEPGTGKTRLLAELCARAHGARAPGARRARRRRWSASCRSASGWPRSTTTSPRWDPTASRRSSGIARPSSRACCRPPRERRRRRSAGSRTSASAPTARCARCSSSWRRGSRWSLVLDDIHWADEASLELIVHLLRRPAPARILTALAFRDGQLPASVLAALEAARAREQRQRAALDAAVGRRGGRAHGRARCRRPCASEVYRQSGGNPFYLAGAGPCLAAAGAAAVRRRGWSACPPRCPPRSGRRSTASASARGGWPGARRSRAIRPTSTSPPPPPGWARSRRSRRWTSWSARDVLRATAVPRRYAFRHPIVRRAVYEAAGEAWRLGAHARAAAALAARPSALAARAHHVERSRARGRRGGRGGPRAGGPPGGRASAGGRRALAVGGAAAAARPTGGQRRAPARHARRRSRRALAASGRLEEALDALLQTLGAIPPELAELRVRLVAACASCENALGRHDAAHARLLHALAELPDDGSAGGAALQVELAADALYDSDFDAMRRWAERGGRRRRRRSATPGCSRWPQALVCFAEYALGGPGAGRAGARRERRRARRAPRRAARRPARPAVLPRLRRVLLRALRGRGAAPPARHRARARGRPGPVRRADDGRAGAGARAPRPPARGAEHRGGGGRGQPPDRQPAGRGVRARRRGVDGGGAGRRRSRPRGRRGGRGAAGRRSTRACSRARRTPTSA